MIVTDHQPKPLGAWRGAFGAAYTARNAASDEAVRGRTRMWARMASAVLGAGEAPRRVLEVGANLGLNLRAIPQVWDAELWAVEPNAEARRALLADNVLAGDHLIDGFGHDIPLADGSVDLAFTTGVLIHVDPSLLDKTMDEIHRVSARYILCGEYFASQRQEIEYRGEAGLLFKDDYGGRYLDRYPDLELVDYGFFWKRATGLDDITWHLFKKRAR